LVDGQWSTDTPAEGRAEGPDVDMPDVGKRPERPGLSALSFRLGASDDRMVIADMTRSPRAHPDPWERPAPPAASPPVGAQCLVGDGEVVVCESCGAGHEVFTLHGEPCLQVVRCGTRIVPVGMDNQRLP
jgi:hypothetical protein